MALCFYLFIFVPDIIQVEVIRTYTAKQPDEMSLQVADVVLVSQHVDGIYALLCFGFHSCSSCSCTHCLFKKIYSSNFPTFSPQHCLSSCTFTHSIFYYPSILHNKPAVFEVLRLCFPKKYESQS